MFRIKICGVTNPDDARLAAEAGADAIGLNFFAGSKRYIRPEIADSVAAAIPQGVLKVGVFVNADAEFVCRESDRLRLDLIQLAGDETPEYVAKLAGRRTMKVFRPKLSGNDGFSVILQFMAQSAISGSMPALMLIDAHVPGEFGGTGKTVDWTSIGTAAERITRNTPPLVLAGGLTPENVGAAILSARPSAVDVASGVESSPGVKDPTRMRMFVGAARHGFACADALQRQSSSLKPQASSLPHNRP